MTKISNFPRFNIKKWFQEKRGMSEVAAAIFVLPIIAFLIFALVEAGINMHTRARINSITQDTAMNIANDGALYWARTSPSTLNSSYTWADKGSEKLQWLCKNVSSGGGGGSCDPTTASMTCSVNNSSDISGGVSVAKNKGSDVTCRSVVKYKTVSPLSRNPVTSLGFSGLLTSDIESQTRAETVVGYED